VLLWQNRLTETLPVFAILPKMPPMLFGSENFNNAIFKRFQYTKQGASAI
jgi:hypothetical protein